MYAYRVAIAVCCTTLLTGAHPFAAPELTSLTNRSVKYARPQQHYIKIQRGPVQVIIADNEQIDVPDLPQHRAGYNGVASLKHGDRDQNLFVPSVSGLNFEHIHDGTTAVDKERFEPRRSPMQLRVVDEFTVEVYQPPTTNWQLESCGRYHLLPDGTVEYTFECIPRARSFSQGYIGLFWASYINQPEDKSIYFSGSDANTQGRRRWLRGVTPRHGVDSTRPPSGPLPELIIDPKFSLTLVNHRSQYVYTNPWYYGLSHGMAYVLMFRKQDRIWFAQSPTGGGAKNPAWDFQWFIPDYKVDEAYGFIMRAAYRPFENREQLETATRSHRDALNAGNGGR